MRIALQIGPERGLYREKADQLVADAVQAEELGFTEIFVPQIPDDFDAMTAVAIMGRATSRIRFGTAVVPLQSRHPVAMAQQALATQVATDGRFTLGVGPSHHWIVTDMLGLPYERPATFTRHYLEALNTAFAGPGPVDVVNDEFTIHCPLDVTDYPLPILVAALAPVMLKIAGQQASGTILWLADEKNIDTHIRPRITEAAEAAGRPAPRIVAGVPVTLCADSEIDAVREWANARLGHAEYSPNYQRLIEHGDASDVGDLMPVGGEEAIRARMERYREVGVTDFSVRVLPYGQTRDERLASKQRTLEFLSTLCPEL